MIRTDKMRRSTWRRGRPQAGHVRKKTTKSVQQSTGGKVRVSAIELREPRTAKHQRKTRTAGSQQTVKKGPKNLGKTAFVTHPEGKRGDTSKGD